MADKKQISVYLGKNKNFDEKVTWIPKNEKNPHLIAVGGSGSGKTETLKAIMLELKNQEVNSLILDFHNDFKIFADNLIQIDKATLHPFEIQINEKPLDVCYKVSKMIANIFSLGDVQEAIIRDAIKEFYYKSGIKDLKEKNEGDYKLMPFHYFKEVLLESQIKGTDIKKLVAKISVLFDVDLFMKADETSISLDTIIKQISVIELLQFPTDEVKSLVADLILNKLINYLYIKGKSDDYWLYVVIDEAHRMIYPGSPIELLLRESRKYGVGVILASQRPTDFSETILANSGTILAFQASLDKDAVFLSKQLRIPKESFQKLKDAGLGYCLFSSKDDSENVQIVPVDARKEYRKISDDFDEDEKSEYFLKEQSRIKKEKEKVEKLIKRNEEFSKRMRDIEKENDTLKAEVERKEYTLNKYENEIKEIKRENVKLNHDNDKATEKLEKIEGDNGQLIRKNKKSEASFLDAKKETEEILKKFKNKLKNIQFILEEERDTSLLKKPYINLLEKIDLKMSKQQHFQYCKKCYNEVENNKYCDCCGDKTK